MVCIFSFAFAVNVYVVSQFQMFAFSISTKLYAGNAKIRNFHRVKTIRRTYKNSSWISLETYVDRTEKYNKWSHEMKNKQLPLVWRWIVFDRNFYFEYLSPSPRVSRFAFAYDEWFQCENIHELSNEYQIIVLLLLIQCVARILNNVRNEPPKVYILYSGPVLNQSIIDLHMGEHKNLCSDVCWVHIHALFHSPNLLPGYACMRSGCRDSCYICMQCFKLNPAKVLHWWG